MHKMQDCMCIHIQYTHIPVAIGVCALSMLPFTLVVPLIMEPPPSAPFLFPSLSAVLAAFITLSLNIFIAKHRVVEGPSSFPQSHLAKAEKGGPLGPATFAILALTVARLGAKAAGARALPFPP